MGSPIRTFGLTHCRSITVAVSRLDEIATGARAALNKGYVTTAISAIQAYRETVLCPCRASADQG